MSVSCQHPCFTFRLQLLQIRVHKVSVHFQPTDSTMILNNISAASQKTFYSRAKYPGRAIGALEMSQRKQVSKCQVELCHFLSTLNHSILCAVAYFRPVLDPPCFLLQRCQKHNWNNFSVVVRWRLHRGQVN